MKCTFSFAGLFASLAVLYGAGCNTQPHPGIEAGNPNVSVKSVRILPKDGDEIYEVTLLDETTADVSRIRDGAELQLLDEVTVPYRLERNLLSVEAAFDGDRAIDVTASFSDSGDSVSGVLKVDGGFAEACFEVPGQTPSCDNSDEDIVPPDGGAVAAAPRSINVSGPVGVLPTDIPLDPADHPPILTDPSSLSAPPPDAPDPSNSTAVRFDPYDSYCTTINGRPACKVPPDFGVIGEITKEAPKETLSTRPALSPLTMIIFSN